MQAVGRGRARAAGAIRSLQAAGPRHTPGPLQPPARPQARLYLVLEVRLLHGQCAPSAPARTLPAARAEWSTSASAPAKGAYSALAGGARLAARRGRGLTRGPDHQGLPRPARGGLGQAAGEEKGAWPHARWQQEAQDRRAAMSSALREAVGAECRVVGHCSHHIGSNGSKKRIE